jgi:nucleoid DNA-binding protein
MAKAPAKATAKKALTKSAIIASLADTTELSKADVTKVVTALTELIETELKKGAKQFTLPGIVRFGVKQVKAVKGGVKKVMPATGLEYTTKDKPAYSKVTVRPAKSLKDALK